MIRSQAKSHRRGVTLLETLVVGFIIILLLGLIIPATLAVRENSRRLNCVANLHQLGLALQSYTGAFGVFPAGSGASGQSFLVGTLPFLGSSNQYNSLNFSTISHFGSSTNLTVRDSSVSCFVCPADNFRISHRSGTSYCGNRGGGVQAYGYNGAFTTQNLPQTAPADFADGLSNTAMVSEWLGAPNDHSVRDSRRSVFRTRHSLLKTDHLELFAQECVALDVSIAPFGGPPTKGSDWLAGEFGFTLYNHTIIPNLNSCTNGTAFQQGAWTTSSEHSHGVNVLCCDGHVFFASDTLDLAVWRALGSRNGGEPVDSEMN